MSISHGKIRNLMLASAVTVALTVMAANHLVLKQVRREAVRQATMQQESSMATFWEVLYCRGRNFQVRNGALFLGEVRLDGNNDLTDEVFCITGSRATIFSGDRRVATNVLFPDGRRALGTRLSGPAYQALFREKVPYRGVAEILGVRYFTAYDPIRDAKGKVIGALFVGVREDEYLAGYRWVNLKIEAINGALAAIFVVLAFWLLAERKRSQDAIERQLAFLRALSDTIPSPVFAKDAAGRYNHLNQAFLSFVGKRREELIGKTVQEVWPDRLAERYHEADRELFERTGQQLYECQVLHADGTLRDVIFRKATYGEQDGVAGGLVGVLVDITERKAAEEELKNAYQRTADILEFLPDAAFVLDAERRVIAWNQAMEEITGIPKGEIMGRGEGAYAVALYGSRRETLIDLLDEEQEAIDRCYPNGRREGRSIFGDVRIERFRGGEDRIFRGAASFLLDRRGERIGSIETLRDVTELRRAQEEKNRLEAQLHHSKMVESLMVQLSHDLKTPLTPLFALLPLIAGRAQDPQLKRMAEICRQSAGHIEGLAEKSIQLLRLSAQGERPSFAAVRLREAAQEAAEGSFPGERGVQCLNLIDAGLEILGDGDQLALLFQHLLDNAARFAEEGGTVELRSAPAEDEVLISVKDDGAGLAPEHTTLIFREFFKSDTARHDLNTQGLGLAICQRVVANHGGRIWAQSAGRGKGTTVFFTLPKAPAEVSA